jgi:hypothetical protein
MHARYRRRDYGAWLMKEVTHVLYLDFQALDVDQRDLRGYVGLFLDEDVDPVDLAYGYVRYKRTQGFCIPLAEGEQ